MRLQKAAEAFRKVSLLGPAKLGSGNPTELPRSQGLQMPDPLDQNGLVAQRRASPWHSAWAHAVQAGPPLLFGLRLWTAVCLSLYLAFWLELDSAYWAGTSAALVCQPHLGASLRKGWFRIIGTLVGAVSIVASSCVVSLRDLDFCCCPGIPRCLNSTSTSSCSRY
jgi:Fusaric acid resistance protein family